MATKKSAAPKQAAKPKWRFEAVLNAAVPKKLTKVQLEQLAVLATFYDGLETTVKTLPPGLFSKWTCLSKVLQDGEHRFDLWTLGADSGCLFWKHDKEPVGIEIIQTGWGAYPKQRWVKRGLKLDLRHLAWELQPKSKDPRAIPTPEPAPQKTTAMKWKPRRVRKSPDDCELFT